MSVLISVSDVLVNVVLSYSPQEGSSLHSIFDFYVDLNQQISTAELAGYKIYLVGDFNAKIGNKILLHDNHNISRNGKYLLNVVEEVNYFKQS